MQELFRPQHGYKLELESERDLTSATQRGIVEAPPQNLDFLGGQNTVAPWLGIETRQVMARVDLDIFAASLGRPLEHRAGGFPELPRVADRRLAVPAGDDVVLHLRDVVVLDLGGDHAAEGRAGEAPEVADSAIPAFDSRAHLAVRLPDLGLGPSLILVKDLGHRLALAFSLVSHLTQGLHETFALIGAGAIVEGLGAGVEESELVLDVEADPDVDLLSEHLVKVTEVERGVAGLGLLHEETRALVVIELGQLVDLAVAVAIGKGFGHWLSLVGRRKDHPYGRRNPAKPEA